MAKAATLTHLGAALVAVASSPVAQQLAATPAKARTAPTAGKTITVVATANPKKPGSASHARFALYTTGQTVAAYVAACKAAGHSTRNATADLAWDSAAKRNFITLA